MSVKERLLEFIKSQGLAVSEFERKAELGNGYVSKERRKLSKDKRPSIRKAFPSLNLDWVDTGEGEMLLSGDSQLNIYDVEGGLPLVPIGAIAGFSAFDEDGISLRDCPMYVVPEFVQRGANFLIRVNGDSMQPTYRSGDILACRKIAEARFIQGGKVYVIDSSQGQLVKRLLIDEADNDSIICVSDNKDLYQPFKIPKDDIRSMSLVVGMIRMEE